MNSKNIKLFYDGFLKSRMLDYRIRGNKRIEKAVERILTYVFTGDNILDIGCGIGMVAEQIARKVGKKGHVWGLDISEQNISYANKTVHEDNITFFTANIVKEQEIIRQRIPSNSLDIISLVDVIEHIPARSHADVFRFFRTLCRNRANVIITYPSPQYQRHLIKNNQDELQVIDQIIELDDILAAAEPAGFSLKHYSLEKVWNMHNQYAHCVLQTDDSLWEDKRDVDSSAIRKLKNHAAAFLKSYIIFPIRKHKYVNSVFDEKPEVDNGQN